VHAGRPLEFKALVAQFGLKIGAPFWLGVNGAGSLAGPDGICRNSASRFAYIPFDWMQPVAAIGYVGCAEIFAGGQ
jgi:hypothetical protein